MSRVVALGDSGPRVSLPRRGGKSVDTGRSACVRDPGTDTAYPALSLTSKCSRPGFSGPVPDQVGSQDPVDSPPFPSSVEETPTVRRRGSPEGTVLGPPLTSTTTEGRGRCGPRGVPSSTSVELHRRRVSRVSAGV